MTAFLPPNLANLFKPRPPLPYLEPLDKDYSIPSKVHIDGVGEFLKEMKGHDASFKPKQTVAERKKLKTERRQRLTEERLARDRAAWNPFANGEATKDAYKTLIVARLNYETTEETLHDFFKRFGPVVSVKLVLDRDKRSRGYAFVEFEDERDLRDAFRKSAGAKIDNHSILVDVERGRTVKNWLPRRLGGGLGDTRIGGAKQAERDHRMKQKLSGARDRHAADGRPQANSRPDDARDRNGEYHPRRTSSDSQNSFRRRSRETPGYQSRPSSRRPSSNYPGSYSGRSSGGYASGGSTGYGDGHSDEYGSVAGGAYKGGHGGGRYGGSSFRDTKPYGRPPGHF